MKKGLIVHIYKAASFSDSTNGGVTAKASTAVLIGDGVPEIFEAKEGVPVLKLVKRNISGRPYLHAEPVDAAKGVGWMSGGNFIYSSDSRFPSDYPISVHDRTESQAEYDSHFN